MPQSDEGGWLQGRTRHVRVYLTDEEHAIVRQAAAQADKSVSRFSIEAIVEAARKRVGAGQGEPEAPKKTTRKRKVKE